MSPPSARSATRNPTADVTAPPYDVLTPEARDDVPRARPAQRRPPDPERLRGRGGAAVPGLARRGSARPRRRAGRVGARARTTSARTGSRGAATGSWRRCASSRTRPAPCSRTSAPTRGRRRAGCGCCAPRRPSSSRSSSSTTASLPLPCRIASQTWPPRARGSGGLPGEGVAEAFADRQLLIADGHHRYETAVAYAAEAGTPESARMMVVLVSTSDPGLEIFPTHRLFRGHEDALPPVSVGDSASPAAAVTRLAGAALRPGARGRLSARASPSRSSASRASWTSSSSTGSSATRGSATRRISARRSRASTRASSTVPSCCGRRGSRTCSSARAAAR